MSIVSKCGYALLLSMPLFAVSASAGVITYEGIASVVTFDPLTRKDAGATTLAPATYLVALGGSNNAKSASKDANGGSVISEATTLDGQAQAFTQLQYIARLSGPDGPRIKVRVLAGGYADGFGVNSSSSASFLLQGTQDLSGGLFDLFANASDQHGVGRDEFLIDTVVQITPNIDFLVNIRASASAGFLGAGSANFAQAFVDPRFIVLDPVLAANYHFEGIPQAAVTSNVPEPTTGLLLMLGMGALGVARRKHHAVNTRHEGACANVALSRIGLRHVPS